MASVQTSVPIMTASDSRHLSEGVDAERGSALGKMPLCWVVVSLLFGAVLALWPLWLPLVLAAWSAALAKPLHERLRRALHGRRRAAFVISGAVVVLVLVPLTLIGVAVAAGVSSLIDSLRQGGGLAEGFLALTASDGRVPIESIEQAALGFLQGHGGQAMSAAAGVLGVLAAVTVQIFVFVYSFYTFMVHRHGARAWVFAHAPLSATQVERLSAAFYETGRALLVGLGLTALLQGVVATGAYALIGLPRPLLLGSLTGLSSLLPVVGTALVWGPTSFVLFTMGQTTMAVATLCTGLVIGMVDNILRPALARRARLQAPMYVVLIAMLGGLAAFGGGGLLLGPLVVRLLLEALQLGRRARTSPSAALSLRPRL